MERTTAETLARVRRQCAAGEAKAIRLQAGLSLSELGDSVGTSHVTVHRWETGARVPRGEAALKYGEVLNRLAKANAKAATA